MNRGAPAVVGVVALGLVAGALALLALRPAPAPRGAASPPFEGGAVAVAGDAVVRWVGPDACTTEADTVPVERSVGLDEWVTADIPLVNIYDLSFADAQNGVATGTTASCARGVAVTSDGGRTWTDSSDGPVLLDAWYVDDVVWGVERVIEAPQVAPFTSKDGRLAQAGPPKRPCAASDGSPDQVAFWTPERGLLLCQGSVSSYLLVARTEDGGGSYEALADSRPELGLASTAPVIDVDVAGRRSVWMLFGPGGDCPEGQLRYSDSEGAGFTPLACPTDYVDVDEVLDVSFSSDTDGVMLALRNRKPVMATTSDGGATWIEQP